MAVKTIVEMLHERGGKLMRAAMLVRLGNVSHFVVLLVAVSGGLGHDAVKTAIIFRDVLAVPTFSFRDLLSVPFGST